MKKQPCVYFIADESGRVKIGMSDNAHKRLEDLQTANADELTIVREIPCDNMGEAMILEDNLHSIFGDYHVRGEWYDQDAVEAWLADNQKRVTQRIPCLTCHQLSTIDLLQYFLTTMKGDGYRKNYCPLADKQCFSIGDGKILRIEEDDDG